MRRIAVLGGAAALAALGVGGFVLLRPAPASAGEEGVFENDCCGIVRLASGRLALNGAESVGYDVGRDSHGPYVLPHTYVGALEDQGFEVDGTQPARKLRLDRLPAPRTLVLPYGTRLFVFQRKGLPARQP
jgi:hypothetical protein